MNNLTTIRFQQAVLFAVCRLCTLSAIEYRINERREAEMMVRRVQNPGPPTQRFSSLLPVMEVK